MTPSRRRAFPFDLAIATGLLWLAAAALPAQFGVRVSGKVLDSEGQPIAGAKILVRTHEAGSLIEIEAESNKKGRYSLVILHPSRQYEFVVRREGFLPHSEIYETRHSGEMSAPISRDFTLEPGEVSATETLSSPAAGLFNEGVEAYKAGDYAKARAQLEKALKKDPDLYLVFGPLAAVLLELGEPEAAAEMAARALETKADDAQALEIGHTALERLGRVEEAEALEAELVAQSPANQAARLLYNQGAEAFRQEDWEAAEDLLRRSSREDPDLLEARILLTRTYLQQEKYEQAASASESIVGDSPGQLDALRLRLLAYQGLGDEIGIELAEKAVLAAEAAAASEPEAKKPEGASPDGPQPQH